MRDAAGTEFVVAVTIELNRDTSTNALRLLSVSPDGASRFVRDSLTGDVAGNITIATGPDARDVRVVYNAFTGMGNGVDDSSQVWWRYDPAGPARQTVIGSGSDYWGRAPVLTFGDDTVLLATHYYGDGMGVIRVASDGRIVSEYRSVASGPPNTIFPVEMVRRGPDAVVVFFSYERGLYLARITP